MPLAYCLLLTLVHRMCSRDVDGASDGASARVRPLARAVPRAGAQRLGVWIVDGGSRFTAGGCVEPAPSYSVAQLCLWLRFRVRVHGSYGPTLSFAVCCSLLFGKLGRGSSRWVLGMCVKPLYWNRHGGTLRY